MANCWFLCANVIHRNEHDLMKDFMDEVPMYRDQEIILDVLKRAELQSNSFEDDMIKIYSRLADKSIVKAEELNLLEDFLDDLQK